MNEYLKKLNKIEFVLTYACTGRCKHCSQGDHTSRGKCIDPEIAADCVRKVVAEYEIETVMVFGGEPLLFPDAVYTIMSTARDLNVSKRQLITNGYFSKDPEKIREVASRLAECGINDLLLSVDAFHQQTIPIGVVKSFAEELVRFGVPIRLQPAWLVSRKDNNPYNVRTREILEEFSHLAVPTGDGNVVFPEGNAKIYLSEYFSENAPINPYTEDPCQVKCLSFEPDGSVLGSDVHKKDIMRIIEDYRP
jgi:hypothetical protein